MGMIFNRRVNFTAYEKIPKTGEKIPKAMKTSTLHIKNEYEGTNVNPEKRYDPNKHKKT